MERWGVTDALGDDRYHMVLFVIAPKHFSRRKVAPTFTIVSGGGGGHGGSSLGDMSAFAVLFLQSVVVRFVVYFIVMFRGSKISFRFCSASIVFARVCQNDLSRFFDFLVLLSQFV
jgi:hypothetical protein